MSLIREDGSLEPTWFQSICARVVRSGPVPRHVAFIMDGNRRFAAKKHVERIEGHIQGFDKLAHTLKWCQDLGVQEVTVYAFSAENFKRSKDEVDSLIELARQKFSRILEEKEQLAAHGVRIKVVGELQMLPPDIQEIAGKIYEMTKMHNKCQLNICFAYTSRLELTQVMRDLTWGVSNGILHSSDVTQDLIGQTLQIPSVDLLIRTSGEIRLSDYLLWQNSFSYLSFLKALWPEFSIWDFYGAVFKYQRAFESIENAKVKSENTARDDNFKSCDSANPSEIPKNLKSRQNRVENFLNKIQLQRDEYYNNLSNGITVCKTPKQS